MTLLLPEDRTARPKSAETRPHFPAIASKRLQAIGSARQSPQVYGHGGTPEKHSKLNILEKINIKMLTLRKSMPFAFSFLYSFMKASNRETAWNSMTRTARAKAKPIGLWKSYTIMS